jgi:hypothetical protein
MTLGALTILFVILIAFILFLFAIFIILPMFQEQVIQQAPVIQINISEIRQIGQQLIP